MIIEIGERIAPERGDKGDFGYPGMNTHTLTGSKIPLILIWVNRPKIGDNIPGFQGEDGLLGGVGLPGQPGEVGEKGETGADGFPVRKFHTILLCFGFDFNLCQI